MSLSSLLAWYPVSLFGLVVSHQHIIVTGFAVKKLVLSIGNVTKSLRSRQKLNECHAGERSPEGTTNKCLSHRRKGDVRESQRSDFSGSPGCAPKKISADYSPTSDLPPFGSLSLRQQYGWHVQVY